MIFSFLPIHSRSFTWSPVRVCCVLGWEGLPGDTHSRGQDEAQLPGRAGTQGPPPSRPAGDPSRLHDLTLLPPRLRLIHKPTSSQEGAEETLTKEHVLWGQQKDADKYQEAERTAANQAAPLFPILPSSELVQFEKWVCFQFHWFLVLLYYSLPSACLFFF